MNKRIISEQNEWAKEEFERLKFDKDFILAEIKIETAQSLLDIINDRGISSEELAEMIGVDKNEIEKIFSLESTISLEMMAKIASALKVEVISPRFVDSK